MRLLSISLATAVTASCAANPGTRPEDMTATEHRTEARRHDRAGAAAPYYRGSYWGHRGGSYAYWGHGYYPWAYYWDSGAVHYTEAQQHDDAAAVLEKRYRDTCGLLDPKLAHVSPFARFVTRVEPVDNGIRVWLATEAGPPDVLLAEVQCHSAWLQLAPRVEAASDVSALAGLQYVVRAEPDAIGVTITARDPQLLSELRRRAELLVAGRAKRTSNR